LVNPTPTAVIDAAATAARARFNLALRGHSAGMIRQVAHRVSCPVCGDWAQLRIAYPFTDPACRTTPVIVMFSCIGQTDEEHISPDDADLLRLLPPDSGAAT
jgi:hypothetical protein